VRKEQGLSDKSFYVLLHAPPSLSHKYTLIQYLSVYLFH